MDFSTQEGFRHESSVDYDSHENGVPERWQGKISAEARNLLIDANAPDYLCSEAGMCAAYLLRLLSNRGGVDGNFPYQ